MFYVISTNVLYNFNKCFIKFQQIFYEISINILSGFKMFFKSNFPYLFIKFSNQFICILFQSSILWNSKNLLFYKISSNFSQSPQKRNEKYEKGNGKEWEMKYQQTNYKAINKNLIYCLLFLSIINIIHLLFWAL